MNLEVENVFFGAFLGFWISEILASVSNPFATGVLLIGMGVLVFLLRQSLYSIGGLAGRVAFHAANIVFSLTIIPSLVYFFPGSLETVGVGEPVLLTILTGTIVVWILSGEITRLGGRHQAEAEFDR
jgi:hypothetical protein